MTTGTAGGFHVTTKKARRAIARRAIVLRVIRSTLNIREGLNDLLHTGFQRLLVLSQTACPSGAGGCSLRGDLGHVLQVLREYTTQVEIDGIVDDIEHLGLIGGLGVLQLHVGLKQSGSGQAVALGAPALNNGSCLGESVLLNVSHDTIQGNGVSQNGDVVLLLQIHIGVGTRP